MSELRKADAHTSEAREGEAHAMSTLTPGKKRFVKRRLTEQSPTVLIGKSGASQEILKEIEKQLEKSEMIKVKMLKTALGNDKTKLVAQKIADQTRSSLVEVRGHTFMLYKRRQK
jgi:RNA-binding protein